MENISQWVGIDVSILNAMVRDNLPWCLTDNFKPIVNV
jgi:hypothetical protein